MKPPVDVILFDLGGTLFFEDALKWPDTYRRAEEALWASLRQSGVGATPESLYHGETSFLQYYYRLRATGLDEPGAGRVLRELLMRGHMDVPEPVLQQALRSMYAITQTNWRLEEDAHRTLDRLQTAGLRLGVVSNGSDDGNAHTMLENAQLLGSFEVVLTSAAFGRRKPDPAIFKEALRHLGVGPDQSLMVGDNYEADIVGAHSVGMRTIWLTRRIVKPATIPEIRPAAEASALDEIPALVL